MNLQRIKTLAESERVEFKALAKAIGMSEGNLHRCVRENKIQAQDLEKICCVLHVKIGYFFDEDNFEVRQAGRDYVEKGKIEHHGDEYYSPAQGNSDSISRTSSNDSDLAKENAELKRKLIAAQERIIELMDKYAE